MTSLDAVPTLVLIAAIAVVSPLIAELTRRFGIPEVVIQILLGMAIGPYALKLAHRGYVMVNGLITMQGSGQELLARPEVRAAYLEGGH